MSDAQRDRIDDRVVFVGETLGPLFLHDPLQDADVIGAVYEAFAVIDARAAAAEWPFAEEAVAFAALELMHEGLANGIDDDMVWEYRRLFVGPGKKPAPPWGSVYTDRECVMFGESTLALRQWMRKQGIDQLGGGSEPEDHIGTMLLLMSWIADHRPEVLEEYLCDHLLTWAGHFLKELQKASVHPFYQGLALLTRGSLEGLQKALGLQIAYPHFYR